MSHIQKILLPVDFSGRAAQAVRFAVPVAERFHSELILLHVLPPYHEFGAVELASAILTDLVSQRRTDSEKQIQAYMQEELCGKPVRRLLREGDPAREIVQCASEEAAGMILMPTHGYGPFRRLLLGSVTAKVLHDADCPVWTTAHGEYLEPDNVAFKEILCAVDLGASSARALTWAAQMAADFGARLSIVHAVAELDPRTEGFHFSPEWRKYVVEHAEAEIARLQQSVGTRAEVTIAMGPPAEMICEQVQKLQAGLLVIGRAANSGIVGRLGGQAYSIIRQSPCPVVSV